MNLFFNPSVIEFQKLMNKIAGDKSEHNVVVDYDGEVLLDPQVEQPNLDLDRFKIRLQLKAARQPLAQKASRLRRLFDMLLDAWNNGYTTHSFVQN